MKYYAKLVVFVITGLLVVGLTSCNSNKQEQSQVQPETRTVQNVNVTLDMLTTDKDLSCGMTLKNGMIADTAIYKGLLYGFCCEDCKNEFKKNPEAAIAKLETSQK